MNHHKLPCSDASDQKISDLCEDFAQSFKIQELFKDYVPTIETLFAILVGKSINISASVTLSSGDLGEIGAINNCEGEMPASIKLGCNKNIIGDSMQTILYPYLKQAFPDLTEGPPGQKPDYFLNKAKTLRLELKCFNKSPGFDIQGVTGYISDCALKGGVAQKILETRYLIVEYSVDEEDVVKIMRHWFLKVSDLCCGYTKKGYDQGKGPLQIGGGSGNNFRPGSKISWDNPYNKEVRTPTNFLDRLEIVIQNTDSYKLKAGDAHKREERLKSIQEQRRDLKL